MGGNGNGKERERETTTTIHIEKRTMNFFLFSVGYTFACAVQKHIKKQQQQQLATVVVVNVQCNSCVVVAGQTNM